MSDFLKRLIDRSTGQVDGLQPRLPARFEPEHAAGWQSLGGFTEVTPLDGESQESAETLQNYADGTLAPGSRPLRAGTRARRDRDQRGETGDRLRPSERGARHAVNPEEDAAGIRHDTRRAGDRDREPLALQEPLDRRQLPRVQRDADVVAAGRLEPAALPEAHDAPPAPRLQPPESPEDRAALAPLALRLMPDPDAAPDHSPRDQPSPAGPVVHVTIGRIDVHATQPSPPRPTPAPRKAPAPFRPALSLDAYLKQRDGGKS